MNDLKNMLSSITGFDEVSLQPNAGAQGELAGLLTIRKFLYATGESQRNICLIPRFFATKMLALEFAAHNIFEANIIA